MPANDMCVAAMSACSPAACGNKRARTAAAADGSRLVLQANSRLQWSPTAAKKRVRSVRQCVRRCSHLRAKCWSERGDLNSRPLARELGALMIAIDDRLCCRKAAHQGGGDLPSCRPDSFGFAVIKRLERSLALAAFIVLRQGPCVSIASKWSFMLHAGTPSAQNAPTRSSVAGTRCDRAIPACAPAMARRRSETSTTCAPSSTL
jgi:hypothetical protein